MINKKKIKANIRKAIKKLPTDATILRPNEVNQYGEPVDTFGVVCRITGLYHEGTLQSITREDRGEIRSDKGIYFMVVYDETTKLIEKDDILMIGEDEFVIKDLGNSNRMDIYLDLRLQEVIK